MTLVLYNVRELTVRALATFNHDQDSTSGAVGTWYAGRRMQAKPGARVLHLS